MKIRIAKKQISQATGPSNWDYLNDILYEMCRKNPKHNKIEVAIGKIMIIGRTYAAAIERRRKVKDQNDNFYQAKVGPRICDGEFDTFLNPLKRYKQINAGNFEYIIKAHKQVNDVFKELAGIEKRSLASKYLHFHFPELFFIYDSIACSSIRQITNPEKITDVDFSYFDEEYTKFALRCLKLQNHIKQKFQIYLNPRQIDKLLLNY